MSAESLDGAVPARTRWRASLARAATGSLGGDSLNGTIGSGGCQLQLTDSNGSIEIARAS